MENESCLDPWILVALLVAFLLTLILGIILSARKKCPCCGKRRLPKKIISPVGEVEEYSGSREGGIPTIEYSQTNVERIVCCNCGYVFSEGEYTSRWSD